jgi:hypothetical protein
LPWILPGSFFGPRASPSPSEEVFLPCVAPFSLPVPRTATHAAASWASTRFVHIESAMRPSRVR